MLKQTVATLALMVTMPAAPGQTQCKVVPVPYGGRAPASAVAIGQGGDMLVQLYGSKRVTGGEMCTPERCNFILVGAAHRKSLIEKLRAAGKPPIRHIEWEVGG